MTTPQAAHRTARPLLLPLMFGLVILAIALAVFLGVVDLDPSDTLAHSPAMGRRRRAPSSSISASRAF